MADNTRRTSDMLLLGVIWVASSSWLLFLSFETMFGLLVMSATGVLILFYWMFSRLLMRMGWLSRRNAILFICFIGVLLTLFPPLYSSYSRFQRLNRTFDALGVRATRTSVEIQLFDSIGDVREHMQGIAGTYQLSMPIEEAKSKMVSVLRPLLGWVVVTDPDDQGLVMYANCDRYAGGPAIGIRLQVNGILTLEIPRFAHDYCYPK